MLRLTVALSLLLYPIPVGVAAASVPQLSFAPTVPVLQLRSPPVLVVLLRLRDLVYHWSPPGVLLPHMLPLFPWLPLVAPLRNGIFLSFSCDLRLVTGYGLSWFNYVLCSSFWWLLLITYGDGRCSSLGFLLLTFPLILF